MELYRGHPTRNIQTVTKNSLSSIENSKNKRIKRVLQINSLMIAVVLCSNFIAINLSLIGVANDGFLPVIFIFSVGLSYLITFLNCPKYIFINKKSLVLLIFIFMFFVITIGFRGIESSAIEYLTEFMGYGFIAFLLTLLPCKPYEIIKYSMLFGIIFILNPFGFLESIDIANSNYDRIEMGPSYAILPCVVAAIIHFFFFRQNKNWLIILGYFVNLILLILLITQASRGAVLAILVLVCFVVFVKTMQKVKSNRHIFSLFMINAVLVTITLISVYLQSILLWLYRFFQSLGIEIATILKTYNMIANKNNFIGLLNGRDQIYTNSIQLFLKSPIWGHGIGVYEDLYGWYPHNLGLQLLIEGGILLAIPILVVVIGCFILLLKRWPKPIEEWQFLLMLYFVVSMPRLMFSSYLWQQQAFWLMIFTYFLIKVKLKLKSKKSN